MYYCFCFPPPSLIFLAFYALLFHEFSCPVFSIRHFARIKATSVFFCAVPCNRPLQIVCILWSPPPGNVAPLLVGVTLFFKAFICSDKRLISCCCLATVSTEIARLAANSASGPPLQQRPLKRLQMKEPSRN